MLIRVKSVDKPVRVIALAVVVVLLGTSTIYRAAFDDIQRTDFTVYQAAGSAVLTGSDIYQAHNARGWNYVYPPPFALLLAPLSLLPTAWGALLWYLLEIAAIGAAVAMVLKLLENHVPAEKKAPLATLALISLGIPLVSGIARCQASEFLVFLLTATICWHFSGRDRLAGISFGAAVLLKVFPLTLAAYFMWRRQWRLLLWATLTLLTLGAALPATVWGEADTVKNYEHWAELVAAPAMQEDASRSGASPVYQQLLDVAKPRNQSLQSIFVSYRPVANAFQKWSLLTALIMMATLLAASRAARSREDELLLCSAFVVWSVLIPPVSESHYFGALLLPLIALYALFDSADGEHQTRASVFTGLMLTATVLGCFDTTAVLRPLALATLLLWVLLVYFLVRKPSGLPVAKSLHHPVNMGFDR